MSAPTVEEILDEPTHIPPEDVIRWRQHTGSQLASIWGRSPESQDNHLLVILGNTRSNRPLTTPLLQVVGDHEDADLEASALEYWEQMWKVPDPQILDFDASLQRMRIVVVTSVPVSQKLIQELLDCVRDNVSSNLPDYLLTA